MQVPTPASPLPIEYRRTVGERTTLSGARLVDQSPRHCRTWQLTWPWLSADDATILYELYTGVHGSPLTMVDDTARQLLPPSQAHATALAGDVTGWTILVGGGQLWSAAWGGPAARRQLAWDIGPAGVGRLVTAAPRSQWLGVPVIPGSTYRWQCLAKAAGTVLVTAVLEWMAYSGTIIKTVEGAQVAATLGGATCVAQGVCPTGAAWVRCRLDATTTGRAVLAGGSTPQVITPGLGDHVLGVDRPQLAITSAGDEGKVWAGGGGGVPLVVLTDWSTEIRTRSYLAASLTALEVGSGY